jgi:hypothetical protein
MVIIGAYFSINQDEFIILYQLIYMKINFSSKLIRL